MLCDCCVFLGIEQCGVLSDFIIEKLGKLPLVVWLTPESGALAGVLLEHVQCGETFPVASQPESMAYEYFLDEIVLSVFDNTLSHDV